MSRFLVSIGLLFLFGSAAECRGELVWRKLPSGTLSHLRALYFVDSETGWAGGSSATLLRTSDGGDSWSLKKIDGVDTILDIHFTDQRTGWLLCEKDIFGPSADTPTVILRTSDGGETWNAANIETGRERFSRFMLDANGGIAGALGESGTLLMPAPDLKDFRRVKLANRAMLTGGLIDASGRSIIVGGLGTVLISMDRGSSWAAATVQRTGQRLRLNAVAQSDDKTTLIAVGRDGQILRSTDSGASWSVVRSPVSVELTDVVLIGDGRAVAIGEEGVAITSTDEGATWSLSATVSKHRLERIHATRKRIFAVGFGGSVISSSVFGTK